MLGLAADRIKTYGAGEKMIPVMLPIMVFARKLFAQKLDECSSAPGSDRSPNSRGATIGELEKALDLQPTGDVAKTLHIPVVSGESVHAQRDHDEPVTAVKTTQGRQHSVCEDLCDEDGRDAAGHELCHPGGPVEPRLHLGQAFRPPAALPRCNRYLLWPVRDLLVGQDVQCAGDAERGGVAAEQCGGMGGFHHSPLHIAHD